MHVRKNCPEKILSASLWFICLRSVAVTGVERETDRAKDRRREVDAEPADSWKKIKISHITSPRFNTGPHIHAARAQTPPRCDRRSSSDTTREENKTENKQNESQSTRRCISYAEELPGTRAGDSITDGGVFVCVCMRGLDNLRQKCFLSTEICKQGKTNEQII